MPTNTYVALDKVTVSGTSTSTITFSSIPQGYTDLRIVFDGQTITGSSNAIAIRFNGSSAAYYSRTFIGGNGSTAYSGKSSNLTEAATCYVKQSQTNVTWDIMNYSNTTTFKTALSKGSDASSEVIQHVFLWRGSTGSSTAAITDVTILLTAGNFLAGSTFSLYGIAAQVQPGTAKATGGTITYDNFGRVIHTFTASGTFTPTTALTGVEYLVIAGGGGAANSGAGGAGGYRSSASGERSGGGASAEATLSLASGTGYTVTVGAGGNGGTGTSPTNGSDSVFGAITSVGGGAGRYISGSSTGNSGGSGGGGSTTSSNGTGGAGTANQGYAGGGATYTSGYAFGGGGGGAGSIGITAAVGTAPNGGSGVSSSINGTATSRAGGGGGGSSPNAAAGTGSSGGGNGELGSNANNTAGTANTGGGGGGGYNNAGKAGGSGIVIVRYQG